MCVERLLKSTFGRQAVFEGLTGHLGENVQQAPGHVSQELRRKMGAAALDFGLIPEELSQSQEDA